MVVLGERHTKDAHVSSIKIGATGDGGGGHVVADHSVHVPRGLHGGETVEEPLLRATANHLCRGAHDWCWGSCCGGRRCRGRPRSAVTFYLLRNRLYVHNSGHRLTLDFLRHISEDVVAGSDLLSSLEKNNYVRLWCHQELASKALYRLENKFVSR